VLIGWGQVLGGVDLPAGGVFSSAAVRLAYAGSLTVDFWVGLVASALHNDAITVETRNISGRCACCQKWQGRQRKKDTHRFWHFPSHTHSLRVKQAQARNITRCGLQV
jgi:hypothetical protein